MSATALPFDTLADDFLARSCAADVRDRFADYNARFRAITRRAKGRFERREWAERRNDAVERIELYDRCVQETREHLEQKLGPRARDKTLWAAIRRHATAVQCSPRSPILSPEWLTHNPRSDSHARLGFPVSLPAERRSRLRAGTARGAVCSSGKG